MLQNDTTNDQNTSLSKRSDWEANQFTVRKEVLESYLEHRVVPTQEQLAERCGLSRSTVQRHLQHLSLEDVVPQYRAFGEMVIDKLMMRAIASGDPSAVKLYFQLVFGWNEKEEIEKRARQQAREEKEEQDELNKLTDEELKAEVYRFVIESAEELGYKIVPLNAIVVLPDNLDERPQLPAHSE